MSTTDEEKTPTNNAAMSTTDEAKARTNNADYRQDFIKRLFAVAVSVGFATPLTHVDWITKGSLPGKEDLPQIFGLVTALLATIGSWEGYFAAISERKLTNIGRFIIDIILVLLYMILLISSVNTNLLFGIIAFIFFLYVVWDALTIWEYPGYYYYDDTTAVPTRSKVITTYWRGCGKADTVRRGHVITVLWAVYFLGLFVMALYFPADSISSVCVRCAAAWIGLVGYRINKAARYETHEPNKGKAKRKTLGGLEKSSIFIVVSLVLLAMLLDKI